jgi:intraflagellar transport protein 46
MASVKPIAVKRLEDAANKPRAIDSWITSITNLHRDKPPQHVQYTARMPEIDALMQEWPPAFEQVLSTVELPSADLNVSLKEYTSIVCGWWRRFSVYLYLLASSFDQPHTFTYTALLDIPVHKSRVESLHLLFSLFIEFKNSQHFKARNDTDAQPTA